MGDVPIIMIYWIWLSKALGAGNAKFLPLIEKYKTAQSIYNLSRKELSLNSFLNNGELYRLGNKNLSYSENILKVCNEDKIKIITYNDKQYPSVLRELINPPICLYVKGEFIDFDTTPFISMVGKRECSDYGKKVAWSLSARLTLGGITVLSGGAKGVDAFAHLGALDVGGKTVAVLACGINNDYLKVNKQLRELISINGCLISEYSPEEPVYRQNFSVRNRLLSALTHATVVVEAGKGSGAVITANHAAEQGREVFVITGKPDDPNYYGNNQLLRDGAKPIFEANDIFSEYIFKFGDKIVPSKANAINLSKIFSQKYSGNRKTADKFSQKNATKIAEKKLNKENINNLPLSKNAKMVYNYIDSDFFVLDDLILDGLSFNELLTAVTELELYGLIKAVPGGRYSVLR